VLVPAGEFIMGSDNGQVNERPARKIRLPTFYIDRFKVTNAQYARFVRETGHPAPRSWKGGKMPVGKGDYPVVGVDWRDAVAYAKWCGKRLPTEEEWEKAARGADGFVYPWGNEWDEKYGAADSKLRTARECLDSASPYGCLGMVHAPPEWTASRYSIPKTGREKELPPVIHQLAYLFAGIRLYLEYPYQTRKLRELSQGDADLRVVKGGTRFLRSAWTCRASFREGYDIREHVNGIGFRCAKSAGW